ncbi:MAG TPA: tRNA pseudouridine(55) synthase TruB [Gemmatimonadaceae bacterium]|jgi:tRNA pseudouridine55 synthase|nr:tRNA pseudouridine(55) synthase TruB [Gemmatimonadaceae bacterium]
MENQAPDGLLLVDKPAGRSSHDVVNVVRRVLGVRRAGHAGTLDPFATGLLILLIGRATRLASCLEDEPKTYEATVRLDAETDTDDLTGQVVRTAPVPPRAELERAMLALSGDILQVPPAYSAKQRDGQRAYVAARRGTALALPPVAVRVEAWTVRAWRANELDVRITCAGGTYIRALARDLGRLADGAAHLAALRRVQCGGFSVDAASPLDALGAAPALLPPRAAVPSLPAQVVTADEAARVAHGQRIPARVAGPRAALVDDAGALVALADRADEHWHPRLVMRDA